MITFVGRLNLSQCRRANSRSVPLGRLDLGDRWVTPVFMICAAFSTQCSIVFVQSCKKSGHLSAESVSVWWCGCGYSLLFKRLPAWLAGLFPFSIHASSSVSQPMLSFLSLLVHLQLLKLLDASLACSCDPHLCVWETVLFSVQYNFVYIVPNHTSHLNALTL